MKGGNQETRKQIATKSSERQRNMAASAKAEDRDSALADAIGAAMMADAIIVPRFRDSSPTTSLPKQQHRYWPNRVADWRSSGSRAVRRIIAGRYTRVPTGTCLLKPIPRHAEGGSQGPSAGIHFTPSPHSRADDPSRKCYPPSLRIESSAAAASSRASSTAGPNPRLAIAGSRQTRSPPRLKRTTRPR